MGEPTPPRRNEAMIKRIQSASLKYPFSFLIVGDTAPFPNPEYDEIFRALLEQMNKLRPKPLFMANLGDFAGPGAMDRHVHYLELVRDLNIPNLCVLGNHDRDNPIGWEAFENVHGPCNYSFAIGNTLFVVLNCQPRNGQRRDRNQPDDYVNGPTEADLAYLEECLRRDTHPVRFLMMHQPPDFNRRFDGFNGLGFTHLEKEFLQIIVSYPSGTVIGLWATLTANSVAISLINRGEMVPEDFVRSASGTFLNDRGRKAFWEAWFRRLDTEVSHPEFKYKMAYRRKLEVQARQLSRSVRGEAAAYHGFTTK